MDLLLDTCAALWWWEDSPQLSTAARDAIAEPSHHVFFSAVSAMEIATKVRLGKLRIHSNLLNALPKAVRASGWEGLPLSLETAQQGGSLNWPHRDPFDRLLAAQAIIGGYALITCDSRFQDLNELALIW
ncbi:MAG: type II toxin-antitoxin system VapC family toxin [Verrucomicrobiota bacterium]